MAEYLQWFYKALVAAVPPTLDIVHHSTAAVDIVPHAGGREEVVLANGGVIRADHVILTSGHTPNVPDSGVAGLDLTSPYPVQRYVDSLPDGVSVGVTGMGLVATDVVTALTVGRGGSFVDEGQRMRYERNGREPVIYLASRAASRTAQRRYRGSTRPANTSRRSPPPPCLPGAARQRGPIPVGLSTFGRISFPRSSPRCSSGTTCNRRNSQVDRVPLRRCAAV